MGIAVKIDQARLKREADGHPLTVDDLNRLEAELNAELETALASADARSIVDVREQLSRLPLMRTAAEIEATKNRLNEIEIALEQNAEKKKLIREVVVARKQELQVELDRIKPFYERLNKLAWEQSFAENEWQSLLIERRETKSKLFALTDDLKATK